MPAAGGLSPQRRGFSRMLRAWVRLTVRCRNERLRSMLRGLFSFERMKRISIIRDAPVPWGQPPPYASYPPPPPGSSMYSTPPPVPGQTAPPPYGVQYPPPAAAAPTPPPGTTPSSDGGQNYPPGVTPASSGVPSQPIPAPVYASSGAPNVPSMYPPQHYSYASYYHVQPPPPPPPASVDASRSIATAPWITHNVPPPSPPVTSTSDQQTATYSADAEYDKFMSEMK